MDPASTVHVRCFLPHGAVLEDVASGLPAGALGAYLVENDFIPKDRAGDMVIEQGHWLGRPSRILVRIDRQGSTVRRVEVGGSVRTSLRGKVSAP
jgi:trans-2,3-dihydro-3-hydroxyanthranilate isomerase